jgi:hypothetical protein
MNLKSNQMQDKKPFGAKWVNTEWFPHLCSRSKKPNILS